MCVCVCVCVLARARVRAQNTEMGVDLVLGQCVLRLVNQLSVSKIVCQSAKLFTVPEIFSVYANKFCVNLTKVWMWRRNLDVLKAVL